MKIVAENGTHKIVAIDEEKGMLIMKAIGDIPEEKERVVLLADAQYVLDQIDEEVKYLMWEANQELNG